MSGSFLQPNELGVLHEIYPKIIAYTIQILIHQLITLLVKYDLKKEYHLRLFHCRHQGPPRMGSQKPGVTLVALQISTIKKRTHIIGKSGYFIVPPSLLVIFWPASRLLHKHCSISF